MSWLNLAREFFAQLFSGPAQTGQWRFRYEAERQPKYKVGTTRGTFKVIDPNGKIYFQCPAISGGGGKGFLPNGSYTASGFMPNVPDGGDSYGRLGVSFFIPITPKFPTERTLLGIHFDGGALGTLGCIALYPSDKVITVDELTRARNILRDVLEKQKEIPLEVIQSGI